MDALIYTIMSGAERALKAQQVHANNLANLETAGFRADLELATSSQVQGYGYDARHMSQLQADTLTLREGVVRETGRELDVAIGGKGLLAVQYGEGEAYTRAGGLDIDAEGALSVNGRPVMGDGGPIVLPEYTRLSIAQDGTVSVLTPGQTEMQVIDRLKLVSAEAGGLTKNVAGLLVPRNGGELPADETVRVRGGYLEGSNVSAVEEMVATMSLNRDFEIQMRLYKSADSMAETGNRLVRE
ncbi:MAG: flagellar biosynthesis protein FlgF [Candidatus Dactylopiibacterium carminicum]|uniref:Flagellar basal-body rod protein FlgF n=1 Tax=Candidatus Dactylopiibacterium carminicum TaxID=857335 RepID=A0A272EWI3_9RHOO|nr:flagellar basal body rod protein FlgF [Candidatus Dactylopiibacterium carminicum]KAF7599953.1 flagellar basal body rod protein FlgF [Candidatus Dactylopiibacterium carminicum]PAS94465.1 MAG: flagellar biosynthesis protein FlgF [Candidatus Dactylopiibacterium carminicum]PAS97049.1 MAG: flagellar biosynthesis protein FlgF [Candidatus Dactylopiibacterium carminicum]PAS99956.1 MAG: flagellar biosynthesis protein FlgF [Candidatus Dactylopiibacterium carminicum]